jgi:rod shape-determining protein MreB and related proteins
MLARKLGIDLGTSTVRVCVRGQGVVVDETSLAAIDRESGRVVAIGRQAQELAARQPDAIRTVHPVRDGQATDFVVVESVLDHLIHRARGRQRLFRPDVMVAVPSRATSGQRRAITKAAISGGARQAWLIDVPLAAGLGAGLPIREPQAQLVCDLGGGTTELAVLSLSGVAVARAVPVGGRQLDASIQEYLERRHHLLVSERTAELLKVATGSALPLDEPLAMEVRGRDARSGEPRVMAVSSGQVTEAIDPPLRAIAAAVRGIVADTPPDLAADLRESGVVLTGGGALLRGLETYLASDAGLPVRTATDPATSVVRGTQAALEDFAVFRGKQPYLR